MLSDLHEEGLQSSNEKWHLLSEKLWDPPGQRSAAGSRERPAWEPSCLMEGPRSWRIIWLCKTGELWNFGLGKLISDHSLVASAGWSLVLWSCSMCCVGTYHHRCRSPAAVHFLPGHGIPPHWWNCSPLQELPPLWAAEWCLPTATQFKTEGTFEQMERAIH